MRYRFLRFPEGKLKAVTFSYDDGCRADIQLAEIFNKYGMKGTFNLNSAWLGKNDTDWHLTKEEIQQHIINAGHEIATHGAEHRANGNLRAIDGIQDVLSCRLGLEKDFDTIVRGLAYPDTGIVHLNNGATLESIEHYLKELDIVYARTLGQINDSFNLPQNWYQWMPTAHHDNKEVMELIDKFVAWKEQSYAARREPKLLYLWGHAYEFNEKNNWERMEEICQKLSGKEDTWYATNIEIYDYVAAYNSLVYSADGSKIYNPTLKQIWLDIDGKQYTVKSGETIKI
jgi:peptidoglycan/xylan/chitin deacetylase (PgdA/CDA1 family)